MSRKSSARSGRWMTRGWNRGLGIYGRSREPWPDSSKMRTRGNEGERHYGEPHDVASWRAAQVCRAHQLALHRQDTGEAQPLRGAHHQGRDARGFCAHAQTMMDHREHQRSYHGGDGLRHAVRRSTTIRSAAAADGRQWGVSDDKLTYTFELRDGLKFSDGTAVTATTASPRSAAGRRATARGQT